jgi:hypothetical protein
MNAQSWLDHFVNVEELNPLKKLTIDSLVALQIADRKQKKAAQYDLFQAWVLPKVPSSDPDGKLLTKEEMAKIAKFCWSMKSDFYRSCPAMFAEHCLCEARTTDPKRVPKESDMLDLQHSTVALSYCDILVTGDGYAYQCATQAKKKLAPLKSAEIYRSIAELNVVCFRS